MKKSDACAFTPFFLFRLTAVLARDNKHAGLGLWCGRSVSKRCAMISLRLSHPGVNQHTSCSLLAVL